MREKPNAKKDSENAYSGHNNVAPRYLLWVLIGGGIALFGLLLLSIYLPNLTERVKFFTGNFLNLVVSLAVIAQVLIYRNQWHIERARIDQRLRIADVRVEDFETGKRPIFIVTIANDGLIDATDVKIHIGVRIGGDNDMDWIDDPIVTIPASSKESYFIRSSSWLTQEQIYAFNKDLALEVVGHFTYWPVGKKTFCYKYLIWEGERPQAIPRFVPCDFGPRLNTTLRIQGAVMKTSVGNVTATVQKTQPQDERQEKGSANADPQSDV